MQTYCESVFFRLIRVGWSCWGSWNTDLMIFCFLPGHQLNHVTNENVKENMERKSWMNLSVAWHVSIGVLIDFQCCRVSYKKLSSNKKRKRRFFLFRNCFYANYGRMEKLYSSGRKFSWSEGKCLFNSYFWFYHVDHAQFC